jgi:hypothetical protein
MAQVVSEPRSSFRRKFVLGALFVVLVPLIGCALYILTVLNLSYSDGERSGIVQKFSRKGWVCKTYEGELAMSYTPGLAPTLWNFSVREPALATKINDALGRRVVVHYTEHRGVPTDCFGETNYYVDSVRVVE